MIRSLVCLALVAVPAPAQREVARLRAAFAQTKRPKDVQEARERGLVAVATIDSAALARALVTAYSNVENEAGPLVTRRRKLLLRDRGKEVLRYRLRLRPLRALQQKILERIEGLRSDAATAALFDELVRRRRALPLRLRIALAHSASRLAKLDRLGRAIADTTDAQSIVLLLEAVQSLGPRGSAFGPWTATQLGHTNRAVCVQAAAACESIVWPGSLRPLIQRLPLEDSRLRNRIGEVLTTLTGQPLGTSKTAWLGWLDHEGRDYELGRKRLGSKRKRGKRARATGNRRSGSGYYFGIPQDGNAILYVHDNSLSMRQKLGRRNQPEASRRIDRSRDELCKAIAALKPSQRFNIVLFANRIWIWEKHVQPATPANVARAKKWIRGQGLELGTNTYNAIEEAFVLAGRGSFDLWYEPVVDTVFVLSDGAPTVQNATGRGLGRDDPSEILDAVERWNALGRIRIHSILLGGRGRARNFMQKLATDNGGEFKPVRG